MGREEELLVRSYRALEGLELSFELHNPVSLNPGRWPKHRFCLLAAAF